MNSERIGWIKAHREWMDNPVIWKDSDYIAVWMYLQLNATHTEYNAIFQGQPITLHPGQLITGRYSIAESLSINDQKVKRILIAFENNRLIDRQRSNKNSLISLLFWESEQNNDQQVDQPVTDKQPASDQQLTTNKNVKNEEKEKKVKKSGQFTPPTVEEVRAYCLERGNRVNAARFVDYYAARGWELTKGRKMKDWKACVRTWEGNEDTQKGKKQNDTTQGNQPGQRDNYESFF